MSLSLITAPNLERPDDFYDALLDAHAGLSPAESTALNARLILLLANHIGSREVVGEAIDLARRGATTTAEKGESRKRQQPRE